MNCCHCGQPIELDPESVSGWWKHRNGKYACSHNSEAEPPTESERPALLEKEGALE